MGGREGGEDIAGRTAESSDGSRKLKDGGMVAEPKKRRKAGILGVGLDQEENGPTRLSRGRNFLLVGGSEQTHEIMQETVTKVNERLDRRGRSLEEVSPGEFRDILFEVRDSIGEKPRGEE